MMRTTYRVWGCGICLLLLFLGQMAWATEQERDKQFQEAASAYSRGDYQAAIRGFEALAGDGLSSSLLYNLANSYAQDGQVGRGVLNYERALRLAPGDSDIRGNLELLRKENGLFQEELPYGKRFAGLLGLNQWTVLVLVAFAGCGVILLLPAAYTLKKRQRAVALGLCLVLLATAITGAVMSYGHWHKGVVVIADARLRMSPFESAASIGAIQEGRLLRPGKTHNNYVLVEDETGRSGWLVRDGFELIATPQVSR
ncbi:MAG: hypothetical protein ABFR63_08790 [Thermodesulfobacteriota bacterium]